MRLKSQFTVLLALASCAWAADVDPDTKNHYKAADLLAFTKATEWTIFSLDPMPQDLEEDPFATPAPADGKAAEIKPPKKKVPPEHGFHGFPVLGQTKVTVSDELKSVISTIDEAARHWTGSVAACFRPRHAIRVVSDGIVHDLVICFECMSADLYRANKKVGSIDFVTDARWLPRPALLNSALIRAKVKMPPPPRH